MNKDDIRRQIRARKAMLAEGERSEAARRVFDTLRSMAAYTMARNILLYHSLPDELSTREFLADHSEEKNFFLPRVNGLDLEILPYSSSRLHLGAFHIEEPIGNDTVGIDSIDLVIVPAVAFDRRGNRIGRGRGYYDRLLTSSHAVTIGVCYQFQLLDSFEAEEHDVPVDFIVTDEPAIVRGRSRKVK